MDSGCFLGDFDLFCSKAIIFFALQYHFLKEPQVQISSSRKIPSKTTMDINNDKIFF